MPANVIGLDIGGANLKAVQPDSQARSRAFPLWKSPEQLGNALRNLLDGWQPAQLALTMTGELCDCFRTKREGVERILIEVQCAFPGIPARVWSTQGRFISCDEARREYMRVAAANWHALATLAGRTWLRDIRSALLIDTGSTTTDIIPIWMGKPTAAGLTDPERMHSSELIYTGAKRSPVCALFSEGVAAELFATALDVYLLLGMIPDDPECRDTADGQPATAINAHARLSRMLGGDPEITRLSQTRQLALNASARQRRILAKAIEIVATRLPEPPEAVLFSGSGEFLARLAWADYANEVRPARLMSLSEIVGEEISAAACAYAVARLAEEE
jgi:probable H4MPT-linked C1 transfer pathway protein